MNSQRACDDAKTIVGAIKQGAVILITQRKDHFAFIPDVWAVNVSCLNPSESLELMKIILGGDDERPIEREYVVDEP